MKVPVSVSPAENEIVLSQMYVYPIKSCGGVAVHTARVEERGLEHDRRWMLVDETGTFMSQREHSRMALIRVQIENDGLTVGAPDMPPLRVPFDVDARDRLQARIWNDDVGVAPVGAEADRWFGEFLGVSCRLVHLPGDSIRPVDPDYAQPQDQASFADGFPFLLISETSLTDLNGRLEHPLPMNRFRPNLVVDGCGAFAEDGWRRIRIGPVTFRVAKSCARCKITTVDQATADVGKEPLRTLARFRETNGKVIFGQNLIHESCGALNIGEIVEVV